MSNAPPEGSDQYIKAWLEKLGPSQQQLESAERQILAQVKQRTQPSGQDRGVDRSLSLTAEWAALLREQPVSNTLLAGAAAATILLSLPLGAAATAAKLWFT